MEIAPLIHLVNLVINFHYDNIKAFILTDLTFSTKAGAIKYLFTGSSNFDDYFSICLTYYLKSKLYQYFIIF